MKANLAQIKEATGFSVSTISNALNGKSGVSSETAERVFEVARRIGYFSESKITDFRFVRYKNSGLIVGDTPFFEALVSGIVQECKSLGAKLILDSINKSDPDFSQHMSQIVNDSSSAVIFLATEASEEEMDMIARSCSQALILDNFPDSDSCSSLVINNAASVKKAVCGLIDKGHRNIGYLKCAVRIKNFCSREEGYRQALASRGLPFDERFVIEVPANTVEIWKAVAARIEADNELPTAFFADNDYMALGALKAFETKGIKVPDDVSVVGFDDMPFSEVTSPPLTTIRVEKEDMGRLAARILYDARGAIATKTVTQVCTRLVERESVRAL
ncbi:MAG: LacI family DNA-binding transcriptional regulator [Clostridiales bacterium]|jgi:LacI family transcriptional regulator|nr:LacI family DNA-binding transcriptional regulator [Clostridiales bacterium]MDR2751180.1 LacI family DNA-binding transcriptional regulator [Clostridiales bacterium]